MKNYIGSYNFVYDGSESQIIEHKDLLKEETDNKANEWYIKDYIVDGYSTVTRQGSKPEINSTHLFRFYHKS